MIVSEATDPIPRELTKDKFNLGMSFLCFGLLFTTRETLLSLLTTTSKMLIRSRDG